MRKLEELSLPEGSVAPTDIKLFITEVMVFYFF